jgi:hypothetical protein
MGRKRVIFTYTRNIQKKNTNLNKVPQGVTMKTNHFAFFLLLLLNAQLAQAQKPTTQFNGYGFLEYNLDFSGGPTSYFYLGEHDFFVNSKLNDKISFLGEYVIRFNGNSSTSFLPSIERSLVKYNYYKNHNITQLKMKSLVY